MCGSFHYGCHGVVGSMTFKPIGAFVYFKNLLVVMGVAWAVCSSAMHIVPIRYKPNKITGFN